MKKVQVSEKQKRNEEKILTDTEMSRIIDSYGDDILRLCTLYLKDRYWAEDALQDTFIKVWQKYSTYHGLASEKTWITRIAINVCKNYLRSTWFMKTQTSDIMEIVQYVKDDYRQVEESIDIINAILGLKDKYRAVLLLYYYQEFSVKEISDILNMKQATVLSLLKRGRNQVKQRLDIDFVEEEINYGI